MPHEQCPLTFLLPPFLSFLADPVDDLSVFLSSLNPHSQASTYHIGSLSPTAVAWASYPPSLTDSGQAVQDFLGSIKTRLEEQSNDMDTTNPNTTQSTASIEEALLPSDDSNAGVVSTTVSALDPQPSEASKRLKVKKHKLRNRTRTLRKKLGK